MILTTAIRDHLRADATVLEILTLPKVYKRRAPARAGYPHVVVSIATTDFPTQSNAPQTASQNKLKVKVQVDSFSTEEEQVDRLAEAVASAMRIDSETIQSVTILKCVPKDERDNYEYLRDASDEGVHRITQDYDVHYVQPA